ncbi:glycoside hydrolase family 127 protein [Kitasatospora sp. NBC_00240]|uniref:beta-L-arabinofuranosidase domain-containing protein n=1 Tax=Kitasatospora sp. NBC_00240 TaxID=2903567 RepID=UPI00225555DC|nr:beta-L-arabinofuranosidase domain-containing protein [Kitasatospora sp. NBC_00240]MCX5208864.1 glycoside hydrolase family 127 protein [Kitasatospora sp. NBC_00240]
MSELNRRHFLTAAAGAALATAAPATASAVPLPAPAAPAAAPLAAPTAPAAPLPPVRADFGALVRPFDLGQVQLPAGRWRDNMNRTLAYLRFVDADRLLYNFRLNHGLSTQGAEQCYGWEAPDFEFRSHSQGHFLSGLAQAYAVTGEAAFRDKAGYLVAELAKCQAAPHGYNPGYLSGFPESDFDTVETGNRKGVPYYCVHKTLAGLLDVWRLTGLTQARDVLLGLAAWTDWRTGRLGYPQMQTTLRTEFGGMNAVLTDLYQYTGDARWLAVAQRFDHAAVIDPLAGDADQLSGLHANTQIPKIVGAAREYKATGTTRYCDIAVNFWDIVTDRHSYVFGGNSVGEFFQPPDAIARFLTDNTCESCNTYNMLKLGRELFELDPTRVAYVDHYENALLNQLLAQQDPADPHGHVCYFTPTKPGGQRFYSRDYDTFTCCQGTGLETQTKLMDSIYFWDATSLYVNLFIGSTLTWAARGVTVTQTTAFPASDTTTLTVTGATGAWAMRVRIPGWTAGATLTVNGAPQNVASTPGSYAVLDRTWTPGDTVTVRLPMSVALRAANDDAGVQAVTYGPVVLSGAYGARDLGGRLPVLSTASIAATATPLKFTAAADGSTVDLIPFYDNHHQNYTVYWNADGRAGTASFRLVNATSGLLLGVQDMATTDGGQALQWEDSGTADHNWQLAVTGSALKLRNVNSGKVLGVRDMSTADDADALQWSDNGTADHLWTVLDTGGGRHRLRNGNSGKVLAVLGASAARGAKVVQHSDDGGPGHEWWFVPDGDRRIQNLGSGLLLGVNGMSTAAGGLAVQWGDNGTADHLWLAVRDADGAFRLRNLNSAKVLGVEGASTAAGARVLQWDDNGTRDHLWRLRHGGEGAFRIENLNSGKVLGVTGASTAAGAQIVQADDNGARDHLWRFV